jgi:hypothetical protein
MFDFGLIPISDQFFYFGFTLFWMFNFFNSEIEISKSEINFQLLLLQNELPYHSDNNLFPFRR